MKLTEGQLREIACASSGMEERRRACCPPDASPAGLRLGRARLEQWRRMAAGGSPARFSRRLAWEGLGPEEAAALLGRVQCPKNREAPAWTGWLNQVLALAASMARGRGEAGGDPPPGAGLPFAPVARPFVLAARGDLARGGVSLGMLHPAAVTALEQSLGQRLLSASFQCLEKEFSGFLQTRLDQPDPGRLHDEFVDGMLRRGLAAFLRKYPALARLCVRICRYWVEAAAELLHRLQDDLPLLQEAWGPGAGGQVRRLWPDLSDPHARGRTVMGLEFASGLQLVYKPRGLGPEKLFSDFLGWLRRESPALDLLAPRVLDRGGHGWMEFIGEPAGDQAGPSAPYCRRAGVLLCLVYVLGGTDLHYDNLLTQGDQPVLVDLETLLQPGFRFAGAAAEEESARRESVLATSLIPSPHTRRQGRDLSGLGFLGPGDNGLGHPTAAPARPWRVRALLEGFQYAYQFLLGRRDVLAGPGGPLSGLAQARFRLVLRPTPVYHALLHRSLGPRWARQGVVRGLQLDALSRAFLGQEERHPLWPLVGSETRALERMDIPRLVFRGDALEVREAAGDDLGQVLQASGWERFLRRLEAMGAQDLERQRASILAAYQMSGSTPEAGMGHNQTGKP